MTPEERAPLLDVIARLSYHQDAQDPLKTFLPLLVHRRVFKPYAVVVLGGRGAGKTALFKLANNPTTARKLRVFFNDEGIPDATWIEAFTTKGMHHPEVGPLEGYASSAKDISLRAFWMTHLLRRVHEAAPELVKVPPALEGVLSPPAADFGVWLPIAEANLSAVSATLDATERALEAADRTVFAAYDNLDLIGQFDPEIRRRYVRTLLSLWVSLSNRYERLRGKIFLRDDLFDAGELGFPDASKLRAHAETLTWTPAALFQVVARHLAGTTDAMRSWLRDVPGLVLREDPDLGWVPGEMSDDVQRDFAGKFVWKVIGKGVLKGYTHEWILDRLKDALRRLTPRTMLWFFGFAAAEAKLHDLGKRSGLVRPDDLLPALHQTSRMRVNELTDEYGLVRRIENLRGMTIPLDREEVVRKLGVPRAEEAKGIPEDGDAILRELGRLGVLKIQENGQIDVPDIYRYSFEITPNYDEAWDGFIAEDEPSARQQFKRELPRLKEILQSRWSSVGDEAFERGDYAAARAQCEKALKLAQSADDRAGEAKIWRQLGQISTAQGDDRKAREEFYRAVEAARKAANRDVEADALMWLGLIERNLGNVINARRQLRKAIRLCREMRPQGNEAKYWLALGSIEERADRVSVAAQHFLKALSLAYKMKYVEVLTLREMAWLANRMSKQREALQLMSLVMHLADVRKEAENDSLEAYDELAAELEITPEQRESLRRDAEAAYARDKGWGYLREAFPDQVAAFEAEQKRPR